MRVRELIKMLIKEDMNMEITMSDSQYGNRSVESIEYSKTCDGTDIDILVISHRNNVDVPGRRPVKNNKCTCRKRTAIKHPIRPGDN